MERRRGPRKKVRFRVRVQPGAISAITDDVSLQGVFVRSARVYGVGTRVNLLFLLPDHSVPAAGVIRWARRVPAQLMGDLKGGMGIEVENLPPEVADRLS